MALRVCVTFTYRKPGTQPPVYVAGTYSSPKWEPVAMDYTTDLDGEHTFTKDIYCDEDSWIQYKFRIGDGDHWECQEGEETVWDGPNQNNMMKTGLDPLAEEGELDDFEPPTLPHERMGTTSSYSEPGYGATGEEPLNQRLLELDRKVMGTAVGASGRRETPTDPFDPVSGIHFSEASTPSRPSSRGSSAASLEPIDEVPEGTPATSREVSPTKKASAKGSMPVQAQADDLSATKQDEGPNQQIEPANSESSTQDPPPSVTKTLLVLGATVLIVALACKVF